MDKAEIVRSVLEWIEDHLEQHLDVETIANHSGYSKRAFSDIFKSYTGYNIATYVRRRRLSQSATMLLLTNKPIADIALLFQFETQAYYTRAFKKYFNQTPAAFRIGRLHFEQHQFPLHETLDCSYILDEVQILARCVVGKVYEASLNLSNSSSYAKIARKFHTIIKNEMAWVKGSNNTLMAVISFSPSSPDVSNLKIKYLINKNNINEKTNGHDTMTIGSGKYAKVSYIGTWKKYEKFPSKIYAYVMRQHNLTRREGVDFEVFHINDDSDKIVNCEYYIPIE